MQLTVVSGLMGRLSWSGVPPSLTIFAFFLCRRRSWFFFMRAISSSILQESHNSQHRPLLTEARDIGGAISVPRTSSLLVCLGQRHQLAQGRPP